MLYPNELFIREHLIHNKKQEESIIYSYIETNMVYFFTSSLIAFPVTFFMV